MSGTTPETPARPRVLLHMCCAPCAVYCVEKLSRQYQVVGFFYNPNIHPPREFRFRAEELRRVAAILHWTVIVREYDMSAWFQRLREFRAEPERGRRCSLCFHMRLEAAFIYAREHHFDGVATTLSISPYKTTLQINQEGQRLAAQYGVPFIPEDFKKQNGFQTGKKMAMDLGIKYQNYCGCVYSLTEKKLRERRERQGSKPRKQ